MKRLLSCLLALLLPLTLCACGREQPQTAEIAPSPAPSADPAPSSALREAFDNSAVKLQGTAIGSLSCDTPYRTDYSEVWEVPEGESVQKRFFHYTDGLGLWDTFSVILLSGPDAPATGTDEIENAYALLRADHFGSGSGYKNAVAESDWNWETFCRDMNGAQIGLVNVCNSGAGLQLGLWNQARTFSGVQIGLCNVISEGPVPFLPIVNASF